MSWQDAVERTVSGLGYDLVDATKSAGGLLRVYIDHLPAGNGSVSKGSGGMVASELFITVDDCEKVTRQLQHVLEVDDVAYERLEVSSPGLDRPLKKAADYSRFVGAQIELTLKLPFKGRKKYRGELASSGDGWRLLLDDAARGEAKARSGDRAGTRKRLASPPSPAIGVASVAEPAAEVALEFSLDEVREAQLVPVVDFKGRRAASPAERLAPGLSPPAGAYPNDEVDGGRIQ